MPSKEQVVAVLKGLVICMALLTIVCGILAMDAFGASSRSDNGDSTTEFYLLISGLYLIIFGLLMTVFEIFFPPVLRSHLRFYGSWIGKGVWCFYLGTTILPLTSLKYESYDVAMWIDCLGLLILGACCICFSFFLPAPVAYVGATED